jgi:hypothetical protein
MTEQQIQSNRIKELEAEGYYVLKLINPIESRSWRLRGTTS